MKIAFLMIFVFLGFLQNQNCDKKAAPNANAKMMSNADNKTSPTPKSEVKFDRLPDNIKADTKVVKEIKNDRDEVASTEITTVEKRLNELKARYVQDRLVDEKGREIRFFEPLCRGVSAGYEQDEIDRKEKEKERAELEKNYAVIVLFCDPRTVM